MSERSDRSYQCPPCGWFGYIHACSAQHLTKRPKTCPFVMESVCSTQSDDTESVCSAQPPQRSIKVVFGERTRRTEHKKPKQEPIKDEPPTKPSLNRAQQAYMWFTQAIMAEQQHISHSRRREVMQLFRDPRINVDTFVPEFGLSIGQLALYSVQAQRVRQRK